MTCRSSPSVPTTTAARPRWPWRLRFRRGASRADHPELAQGNVRAGALRDAARARGVQAFVVSATFADLITQLEPGRPVLVGMAKPMALTGGKALAHYEVVVAMSRKRKIVSLDPAVGVREYSLEGFAREWVPTRQLAIVFLPQELASRLGPRLAVAAPAPARLNSPPPTLPRRRCWRACPPASC